jgi:DNA-directed RNA polymerase subunit B
VIIMGKESALCTIFVDGKNIGRVSDGAAFATEIRANRRKGLLSGEINVAFIKELNEVHINADKGRVRKPYIVVENGKSKLDDQLMEKVRSKEIDFNYLVRRGIIEYLDAEEEENIYAAMRENEINSKTTHLEVDPAIMFGVTVNGSVFPEFNSVGKHPLAWQLMKQAQALPVMNFSNRFGARSFLLHYPQAPLIDSVTYRAANLSKHANGQNLIVAVTTYHGYNMSDAVVVNRASIERGIGRSSFFKTYADEERRYPGGQQDRFTIPSPTVEGYEGEQAYTKLGEDGIVEEEMEVNEGDIVIGKVSPPRFLEEQTAFGAGIDKSRDNSVKLKAGESGVVDNVMVTETSGATKIVKVVVRSEMFPEHGDKMGSRHAQKGVIGSIIPQEEMPFTSSGIVPDLLLNPMGLPNRMTAGHILEMLGAKATCVNGIIGDGTPFARKGNDLIKEYGDVLERSGYDRYGNEMLYDGRTGRRLKSEIFIGPVYYFRLSQMTKLKLQVRSRGPVQILTRQPTEGKPRSGGIRFEEMQRDALVGHGASILLKDRMLDQSDKDSVWICRECGDTGYMDRVKNVPVCPMCGGTSKLESVEISYAFKLLLDELKSMHILARINLKSD